ncbi:MAG: tetratricopeptide repeat protein, partial [Bryobacteraceae bacterium]
MMTSNKLRVIGLLAVWCLVAPNGIDGKSKPRKLDRLIKSGQTAEAKGDWDAAMDFYMQAYALDPSDIGAMLFMRRARFQAGQKHVDTGERLRSEGKLEDAVKEFEKAVYADPSSAIAIQDLKTTKKMIEDSKKPGAKTENIGLTPYEIDQKESAERADQLEGPPELKPI